MLYPVIILMVIASMVAADGAADLGRGGLAGILPGVHGEGLLGLLGVLAGALIVLFTPASGRSPPASR